MVKDRSRQECTTAKSGGIPLVAQKSTRSEMLCTSDCLYIGCPVERWDRLLLSSVLRSSRTRGVMSLDPQSVSLAL
jgi:hypothetical protein